MSEASITWDEAVDRWTSILRGSKAPRTVTAYLGDLRTAREIIDRLHPSTGPLRLTNIDRQLLADAQAEFRNRPDGRFKDSHTKAANEHIRSARTVGRWISTLKSFFGWAYEEHLIPSDPAAPLERPKAAARVPQPLTEQEAEALLQAPAQIAAERAASPESRGAPWWQHRNQVIIDLAVGCGLRRSEIAELPLTRIVGRPPSALVIRGKGDKERTIPLPDFVTDSIERYLPERTRMLETRQMEASTLIISTKARPSTPGDPLSSPTIEASESVIEYVVDRCLDHIGQRLPRKRVHALRHTFATLGLRSGAFNLRQTQTLLGHADISTTQVYTQVTDAELEAAMKIHPLTRRRTGKP